MGKDVGEVKDVWCPESQDFQEDRTVSHIKCVYGKEEGWRPSGVCKDVTVKIQLFE